MSASLTSSKNLLLRLARRRTGKRYAGQMLSVAQVRGSAFMSPDPSAGAKGFHSSANCAVKISFKEELSGETIEIDAEEGKSVLDIAMDHNIDIEGACGGELACSTCHVLLSQEYFDRLGGTAAISEEEEDMLDLAWGVTDLSRLGCQICISKELDGAQFVVPSETNSML